MKLTKIRAFVIASSLVLGAWYLAPNASSRRRLGCHWVTWKHKSDCTDESTTAPMKATASIPGGVGVQWKQGALSSPVNYLSTPQLGYNREVRTTHAAAEAALESSIISGRVSPTRGHPNASPVLTLPKVPAGIRASDAQIDWMPATFNDLPESSGWHRVDEPFAPTRPRTSPSKVALDHKVSKPTSLNKNPVS
jgi:hypothetical protein